MIKSFHIHGMEVLLKTSRKSEERSVESRVVDLCWEVERWWNRIDDEEWKAVVYVADTEAANALFSETTFVTRLLSKTLLQQ